MHLQHANQLNIVCLCTVFTLLCRAMDFKALSLNIYKYSPSAPSPLRFHSSALPFPALSSELLIAMGAKGGENILMISFLLTVLISQSLVECKNLEKEELDDQKNYYSPPDPHAGTPPSHSGSPPRRTLTSLYIYITLVRLNFFL